MAVKEISLINGQMSDTIIGSGFSLFQRAHGCRVIITIRIGND